jgi:hypothetical protein
MDDSLDQVQVQHRAVTPDGRTLVIVTMPAYYRWTPYADPMGMASYPGEHTLETRVLPDGEWGPSAVIRQPGRQPVVVTTV